MRGRISSIKRESGRRRQGVASAGVYGLSDARKFPAQVDLAEAAFSHASDINTEGRHCHNPHEAFKPSQHDYGSDGIVRARYPGRVCTETFSYPGRSTRTRILWNFPSNDDWLGL